MRDDLLDNPIWGALTTSQSRWAEGGPDALRFPRDVSPFAAAPDASQQGTEALGALLPQGRSAVYVRKGGGPVPEGAKLEIEAHVVQMHAVDLVPPDASDKVITLGDADAPEMLELATLTRPGPFLLNTHRLGRFIGIRIDGRLAAMAGERLHVGRFHEVSGVCTHPDFRGRGYASLLSRIAADRIAREGDTPFLHAYTTNAAAIRLYESLGFRIRETLAVQVVSRP